MNILIVKLSAIGDVLHTLPALNAIRNQYPDAHITWLVEEAAYPLIKGHKALNQVLVSKRKRWIKNWFSVKIPFSEKMKSVKEAYRFIKELRSTHYDVILDFQALLKGAVLIAASKGIRKIGYDKGMEHDERSYLFLNERIAPVSMETHAILRNMMLLRALGIDSDKIVYNLPIQAKDYEMVNALMGKHLAGSHRPIVAINPIAKWKTKLWDNKKFAILTDTLIEQYNASVFFTGGMEDRSVIQTILSDMKYHAVNLAGETSLMELAALYEKADVVISTDTGPMHLAAAVETPVVAIFGPTAPWRTGPFGSGHLIIRAGLACSPCFKRECPTMTCMKQITVENVIEKITICQTRRNPLP